jgi:peptidoglycan L-alanyl-D-glutamate endopeptidase CwlK
MPSRDIKQCVVELQAAWSHILAAYLDAHPNRSLMLTATYRNVEEQQALYAQGRTSPGPIVTQCDGVIIKSKHNSTPSLALDFAVLIAGKLTWDVSEYAAVGKIAQDIGLVWGGSWPTFPDAVHLEVKA